MTLSDFLSVIKSKPEQIQFADVIAVITDNYDYTPSDFSNGEVQNAAGTNEGSCKILAFAKLHHLSEQETLHLFGDYYRNDVLQHPDGSDHANIRNFMVTGWAGVSFASQPLAVKAS